jgi:serine/threonine-protein kinase PknK
MPDGFESFARSVADRYRIERELGRGGMATVYLAEDLKHRRPVAIKLLSRDLGSAAGSDRFRREIEIAARLSHPHIVSLHDSGVAGDRPYYVMPYIDGESLRARILREGQLGLEEALRLACEIASALSYAHERGLVHRDIKPENVLLSAGIALVADFGIARVRSSDGDTALTTMGTTVGTPSYMSPEQIRGSEEIDGRADLYSLGCVAYEMLAGRPPFSGSLESLVHQHVSVRPRPVSDVRPGVPPHVVEAISTSLAKSPADRFPTAASFAEALTAEVTLAPASVPSASGRASVPNNLPAERTRFIGREKELAECERLLKEGRLLTLTGIGGCGKTRLALKLAESLLSDHPDGVWFVDLAPLTAEERVVGSVAAPLGVREAAGKDLLELLGRHLAGKRLLLVLDNCEHLLPACARLVDALLGASRELRVLATSREGLGIDGEGIFALGSLTVPSTEEAGDLSAVESSEAARLFVDRARLTFREFALTGSNAAAVAEICRRLDGIPLAIELAAARVKVLSADQIRAKLDDRFRLLTGGSRSALPRHQTLRATIQWSDDLLSPAEQRLFRRLSVFAGGWTLELATRVAGDEEDEFLVLDRLARLADKSLVCVDRERGSEPRYGLLDTVRQYGQERLSEAGEAEEVRRRHVAEYLSLAEVAYAERLVREEPWAARLEVEHDNLRAALDFVRGSDVETYLRLSGLLGWFWQARSYFREGREHLMQALASTPEEPARPARARALWGAGSLLSWQGDTAGRPFMHEALRMWRELGVRKEVALALEGIGWAQFLGSEDEAARATFEECLRIQKREGDPVLVNRAMVALAQALVALSRVDEARPMASDIIAYAKANDDRRSEHFGRHFLADCALVEEKCDESLDLYRQSLALARAIGDRLETSAEVQGVAMSLAGLGESERALRLAAAMKSEWERLGVDLHIRFWDALLDRYFGRARAALGAERAGRVWQEGLLLPFEEAVVLALE